jgi:hypothetical protein
MNGPHRRIGPQLLAATAVTACVITACGPESFNQSLAEDARVDLPGSDGTREGAGGTGGTDAGGDRGADAGVPSFVANFDGPGSLASWSLIGQPADVVAGSAQILDLADGFPDPGSARVTIPFSGDGQQVAFGYSFSTPRNFSGKTLIAHVRLNSSNPSGTVRAGLAYKSVPSVYLFASSAVPSLVSVDGWTTFALSFDQPDGFVDMGHHDGDGGIIQPDPKTVLEIDVLILTGNSPYALTDVSVDSISVGDVP